MIARAAKIRFNRMKSSLTTRPLFHGSVKYNYFGRRLFRCPSRTGPCTSQLRLII